MSRALSYKTGALDRTELRAHGHQGKKFVFKCVGENGHGARGKPKKESKEKMNAPAEIRTRVTASSQVRAHLGKAAS